MNKKDIEIQRKLDELESTILKEAQAPQPPSNLSKDVELISMAKSVTTNDSAQAIDVKNEACYFGGIALIILGLVLFFQHVRVGTGFLSMLGLGGGGFGLLLLPLIGGLGWLIYDSKNKLAWLLTGGTCAVIVFNVLNSLVMQFPPMSLLGTIMMLLPFAAGGALLLKGIGGPKAIENKLKSRS